jgi:hypothetical protein
MEARRRMFQRRPKAKQIKLKLVDKDNKVYSAKPQAATPNMQYFYIATVENAFTLFPIDHVFHFRRERNVPVMLSLEKAEELLESHATPLDIRRYLPHLKQDESIKPLPRGGNLFIGEEAGEGEEGDSDGGAGGGDEHELNADKEARQAEKEREKRKQKRAQQKNVKIGAGSDEEMGDVDDIDNVIDDRFDILESDEDIGALTGEEKEKRRKMLLVLKMSMLCVLV